MSLEILYEDNHVIVVNKKASDIVQGDKTGDETLPDKIKQYLKVNKPLADWRALDDAFLEFPKDCPELILCHPKHGITQTEINKLRAWLIQ